MTQTQSLLPVQGIAKTYGRFRRHHVLCEVTFDVAPGTLAGIVGECAGKSTLSGPEGPCLQARG